MNFFTHLFRCKKKDLDAVFSKQTVSLRLCGFSFFSMPTQDKHGRFFTIISKKVGKAYKRNKLRRRLRAIYYQEKLFERPFITILICYPGATTKSFVDLKKMLIAKIPKSQKTQNTPLPRI